MDPDLGRILVAISKSIDRVTDMIQTVAIWIVCACVLLGLILWRVW